MSQYIKKCPNPHCRSEHSVRNGTFKRKSDNKSVRRFTCKKCGRHFSQATFSPCFGQKKRRLNPRIFELYCSGVSLRRMAKVLRINRKTVVRKFRFLADEAQKKEREKLRDFLQFPIADFQFDDMETFESSKLKPLSITLAVQTKTRRILGFSVSPLAPKGLLVAKAKKKYGQRKGKRKLGRQKLLKNLAPYVCTYATIRTDEDPHYKGCVKKFFPKATHKTTKGQRGCVVGQGELKGGGFDPIFSLNHTAAMLRANMNRLFRRTWCTTKDPDRLSDHIWLYMHYHNEKLIPPPDTLSTA